MGNFITKYFIVLRKNLPLVNTPATIIIMEEDSPTNFTETGRVRNGCQVRLFFDEPSPPTDINGNIVVKNDSITNFKKTSTWSSNKLRLDLTEEDNDTKAESKAKKESNRNGQEDLNKEEEEDEEDSFKTPKKNDRRTGFYKRERDANSMKYRDGEDQDEQTSLNIRECLLESPKTPLNKVPKWFEKYKRRLTWAPLQGVTYFDRAWEK